MNDYRRPSIWDMTTPVVKNLIIINSILTLATFVLKRYGIELNDILGMHYWGADKFNPLQMFTYMFMHSDRDITHLLFNMFAVFMFGTMLERTWGSKRFLFYYLVTGIGAGIIQQIVYTIELRPIVEAFNQAVSNLQAGESILPYQGAIAKYFRVSNWSAVDVSALLQMKQNLLNSITTVGASGAVFGILLAFGMLFPNVELFIMFIPIPIKAKYAVTGYGVIELFLGFANRAGDSVAHFAHLGGMLFGIILILYWKKKGRMYNNNFKF